MATLANYLRAFVADTDTVSSTALDLTDIGTALDADALAAADAAHITVSGDAIRYTYDGTTPTATVGHLVADGGEIILVGGNNVQNLQLIRVTGDATVFVTLLKMGA